MKTIKEGDILVSTFGYDARITTFTKVLKRTAKSVTIARLLNLESTGDWMDGTSAPSAKSELGPTSCRKISMWYDNSCECINDGYGVASLWDGNPVRTYNHH